MRGRGKEPHGKQNPKRLEQMRKGQTYQGGLSKAKLKRSETEDSIWNNYFYLLLIGGACVSVTAVALVYAAQHSGGNFERTVVHYPYEAASGSSRPDGTRYRPQPVVSQATLFKPAPLPPPEIKPLTPAEKTESKPKAALTPQSEPPRDKSQETLTPQPEPPTDTKAKFISWEVFKAIHDLIHAKGKLNDIHQLIKLHGAKALNVTLNMQNIRVPHVRRLDNQQSELIDAEQITPLHYAFLTGRMDVFALLLAEGASLEGDFSFSFHTDMNEIGERQVLKSSLQTILFDFPYHPYVRQLCTKAFHHELFIGYLQRRDHQNAKQMITFKLNREDKLAMRYDVPIDIDAANKAFSMLPPVDYILMSLGNMRAIHGEFLETMYFEWAWMRAGAQKKWQPFKFYEESARAALIKQIDEYLNGFAALLHDIDETLNRENYIAWRVSRLASQHDKYPVVDYKKLYQDFIREKINTACHRHFNGATPDNHHVLIRFIVEYISKQFAAVKNKVYQEALLDEFYHQVNGYAHHYKNVELIALSGIFHNTRSKMNDDMIKTMMSGILERIEVPEITARLKT